MQFGSLQQEHANKHNTKSVAKLGSTYHPVDIVPGITIALHTRSSGPAAGIHHVYQHIAVHEVVQERIAPALALICTRYKPCNVLHDHWHSARALQFSVAVKGTAVRRETGRHARAGQGGKSLTDIRFYCCERMGGHARG